MTFPKRGEIAQRILDSVKPGHGRETATKQPVPLPSNECPKCGRKIGRGKHMHIKNCKG